MTGNVLKKLTSAADAVQWLRSRVTGTLQIDSRKISPGDGFIAWPGAATDGRAHVADAIARGAAACLVEADGVDAFALAGEHVATLQDLKAATGGLADVWFAGPSSALDVLAVTGTNGKTSTAWWLAGALNLLSKEKQLDKEVCGLVGTLGVGLPSSLESTGMTTPDPVCLQRSLHALVACGATACAIEASSIGLEEARLSGTRIRTAIFTNFTQDHLDYHASMAQYWQAKRALFSWPGLRSAVVNVDDATGAQLHAQLLGAELDLWSVSAEGTARLSAQQIELGPQGLQFVVREGDETHRVQTQVIGHYNVLNLLGVLATLRSLGIALADAVWVCARLEPVPGRMQRLVAVGQPLVAVDYAHTPDALDKALRALRPLAQERGGQLWCVFGCGGDRDAGKRPLMGAVAQQQADQVIVTSDNPRSEDPARIAQQILQGTADSVALHLELDRAAAIARAVAQAGAKDVVLVAGKGHEDTQETAGVRLPFSDMAHAQQALQARGVGA